MIDTLVRRAPPKGSTDMKITFAPHTTDSSVQKKKRKKTNLRKARSHSFKLPSPHKKRRKQERKGERRIFNYQVSHGKKKSEPYQIILINTIIKEKKKLLNIIN